VTDDPSRNPHCETKNKSSAVRDGLLMNGRLDTDVFWRSLPSRLPSLLAFLFRYQICCIFSFSYFDDLMNKLTSSATLSTVANQPPQLNVFSSMDAVFSCLRNLEKSLISILQVESDAGFHLFPVVITLSLLSL
jgi:hypothetical protein